MSLDEHTEKIASKVINTALKVHKNLGPGLMESAYKECLYYELQAVGLNVEKEKPIPNHTTQDSYYYKLPENNGFVVAKYNT